MTESQKTTPDITIPADLLPSDGRFGSGPTKVLPEALDALAARATDFMGTSHRKMPVKLVVAEMRNGIAELLRAPDGYEIVCGNGGSTGFWDAAVFGLIDEKSHHLSFGEFGGKFAKAVAMAPHLQDPSVTESAMGTRPDLETVTGVDAYAFTHNETSTGVMMDPVRVGGDGDLMLVDATSAAGGLMFDADATDAGGSLEQLLQVVNDHYQPSDSELPDTGVGMDLERLVAPVFIQSETYGTRASSAVILDRDLGPQMLEQVWQPDGHAAGHPNCSFSNA